MALNTRGGRRKKKICERGGINSSTSPLVPVKDVVALSPDEKLPPEMFYQVFQNLDKKSLKNSRLVCRTWRNTVDCNLKLKNSFTFTIVNIEEFLNTRLADSVRSVRFIQPLEGTEKAVEDFFIKIGTTVEEVIFNFGENFGSAEEISLSCGRQKLMFSMLLRFCKKLNRLTIISEDNDYDFIKNCTQDPRNGVVLSMIQNLSLPVRYEYLNDVRELVLNLPNLRYLELNCNNLREIWTYNIRFTQPAVIDIILQHLRNYNGTLKEICLAKPAYFDEEILIKLFLSVGQLCPNTIIKCEASLNHLVNFEDTEDIQVNANSCSAIKEGYVEFDFDETDEDEDLDTSRISFCSNLHSLQVYIISLAGHQLDPFKLDFMKELKKLTSLKIQAKDSNLVRLSSVEVFSFGIPSLTTLDFDGGDGLGLDSLSIQTCFPNLTELCIRHYSGELNENFIYNLTNLEQLESFTLEDIKHLTDEHLTGINDFAFMDSIVKQLPAIVGFKNLRQLQITKCPKLTSKCLKNGLALCNKLEEITLCSSGKYSRYALNFLQKARNLVMEDVKDAAGGFCGKRFYLNR